MHIFFGQLILYLVLLLRIHEKKKIDKKVKKKNFLVAPVLFLTKKFL